jgi:hypothetical protein
MTARTEKSVRLLNQYASDPQRKKDFAEVRANVLNYPRLQALIEGKNIKEIKELCSDDVGQEMIDKLAEDLIKQADREKGKIDSMVEIFIQRYGLKPGNFRPGREYMEASRLRPKRLFKGPLPWNAMNEKLDPQSLAWYKTNRAKAGGSYGSKIYEIVNLMDGKRTLLDIRHIVSCEYDETEVEFVLHYAKDLEKIGLISFE